MSSRSSSSSAERHRRPGHRHHHCHHRRHHHDLSRSSSDEWGPPAAISCAPPLHRRLESNIQRGKYVKFDHLLPSDTPPIAGPAPSRTHGRRARELRSVVDFTSWTEAWNGTCACAWPHTPSWPWSWPSTRPYWPCCFHSILPHTACGTIGCSAR